MAAGFIGLESNPLDNRGAFCLRMSELLKVLTCADRMPLCLGEPPLTRDWTNDHKESNIYFEPRFLTITLQHLNTYN